MASVISGISVLTLDPSHVEMLLHAVVFGYIWMAAAAQILNKLECFIRLARSSDGSVIIPPFALYRHTLRFYQQTRASSTCARHPSLPLNKPTLPQPSDQSRCRHGEIPIQMFLLFTERASAALRRARPLHGLHCTADAHTGLVILSERSVDSSVDWSVVVVLPLAYIRHAEMDEFDPRHVSLCEAYQPGGG